MDEKQYQRICELFEELVDAAAEFQEEKLARIAEDDSLLADEVRKMLQADGLASTHSFLKGNFSSEELLENLEFQPESSYSQKKIGQYQLEEQLGIGGMGVVFRAYDTIAKRSLAIKLLKPGLASSDELRKRTLNEANAAAKLTHPNIVPVYDVGTDDGMFFFTMPLIASGDSKSANCFRYSDPKSTALLFSKIARGLIHAHEQGVIHRDIKPSNIMMDENGTPMIADFGIAKNLENKEFQTETGQLLGSANYMSPEQIIDSKNVTEHSDIYSFGATLYESLTGRPPYTGLDLIELFQKIGSVKPHRPSDLNPKIDSRLEAICLRCLEKEPNNRFQTMKEVLNELERVVEGKPLSGKSNIWKGVSNVLISRHVDSANLETEAASKWMFFHNLLTHILVWTCTVNDVSPIYLWALLGLATINLSILSWTFYWSKYWHLEITERQSAIVLLFGNWSLIALLFVYGPNSIQDSSTDYAKAYPAIALIFGMGLATHGSVHAGKWILLACVFLPLAYVLKVAGVYAPLIFAISSSLVVIAVVLDLKAHGKNDASTNEP